MIQITKKLVAKLIAEQFPDWQHLPIQQVAKSGHDNRTFHLGNDLSVRLPSAEGYAEQIEKEYKWLPYLQNYISLPITKPIALGIPGSGYPWHWSVNQWLTGETLSPNTIDSEKQLALDLAQFLTELAAAPVADAPAAGEHNYYRGGNLTVYDAQTQTTLIDLKDIVDTEQCAVIWQLALASAWQNAPVWIHGDVAVGNLLAKNGRLSAVIDFGVCAIGDPACDLVMAWTYFDTDNRKVFKNALNYDEATWHRARGWALWKALITINQHAKDSELGQFAYKTLEQIFIEFNE
ncbi:aminoglycoside phosphotransferase family protein [Culicoidibacter larvae]|uniref:Aminoglycoside phosphotransferase family protein n=1 Tax=Culicoidibacter larvae TaxID=2579976 RepID=A0A5R8QCR7_9FIRM|nr:aminoglycoside phosphotransferase family protein [Culicoidibacter larvae]TLG74308.1 aminoglycoside phosphotransferase family protein [Culicoidibacter larvae]